MSNSHEVERIVAAFGAFPKEFRQRVRPEIKSAASSLVGDAKRRAAWSKRIPGAIRVTARFSRKNQGVSIRVNAKKAPHGRPFEGIGTRGDTFRHPVFGTGDRRGAHSQDTWVSQKKRPFLAPAVEAHASDVREAVDNAIRDAARGLGWREGI